MVPSLVVGLGLLVAGSLVFSIGLAGTTSLVQIVVGGFVGVVGALAILTLAKSSQ